MLRIFISLVLLSSSAFAGQLWIVAEGQKPSVKVGYIQNVSTFEAGVLIQAHSLECMIPREMFPDSMAETSFIDLLDDGVLECKLDRAHNLKNVFLDKYVGDGVWKTVLSMRANP